MFLRKQENRRYFGKNKSYLPKYITIYILEWQCHEILSFCLYFFRFLHAWIQIHKAPEYGSNRDPDPDPQHCMMQLL